MQENRKCRTKGASWRTGRLVPRRSSLDSRSSRLLSAGLTGLKGAMAAKQRLDDRTSVPWTDERTYSNASARGDIGRSPFATPAVNVACLNGCRTLDCRGLRRWLHRPPVMGCGHGSQRKGKFFHRSAPPWRKTMTKKDPGFIPATPPAHLPAIDLLADLNGSGQAKEFGLQFHGSHLCLWLGCTVKPRKRSTASTEGRGVEV